MKWNQILLAFGVLLSKNSSHRTTEHSARLSSLAAVAAESGRLSYGTAVHIWEPRVFSRLYQLLSSYRCQTERMLEQDDGGGDRARSSELQVPPQKLLLLVLGWTQPIS